MTTPNTATPHEPPPTDDLFREVWAGAHTFDDFREAVRYVARGMGRIENQDHVREAVVCEWVRISGFSGSEFPFTTEAVDKAYEIGLEEAGF
ncbi:MAG: hypothetical protein JWO38_1260 [Gemmataceae bacterium]|nr:hypothetical protein [Gemmataceae bacterium]